MEQDKRYTKEQIEQANAVQLAPLLRQRGYVLKPSGSEWLLQQKGVDNITIRGNKWYSHYQKRGGRAVSFCQHFFGCGKEEAVEMQLGVSPALVSTDRPQPRSEKGNKEREVKEVKMPPANQTTGRVYDYLTKQRLLDPAVVRYFIGRGMIYESAESLGNHYVHNLVLVGIDGSGTPRQAHIKGIMPDSHFRRNAAGSDARYGFAYYGKRERLYVFEAAIDLMSFLTMYPYHWQESSYLALDGTAEHALLTALDEHPNLKHITLCLDHDPGGQVGTIRLQNILLDRGILADVISPKQEKDWNEQLRRQNFQQAIPASDHPLLVNLEQEFQNLIDRGMLNADKKISMMYFDSALQRFDAWSQESNPENMACPLRNAALIAGIQAKEQLRHIGKEMDIASLRIRLFKEIGWPSDNNKPENYLRELLRQANELKQGVPPALSMDETQKQQTADGYLHLAAKCLALCAYYDCQQQKLTESEVNSCQMRLC